MKYTKLVLSLAVLSIFSVSCKKEAPKVEEQKKEVKVTQKEVKVEENKEKEEDKQKEKDSEKKEDTNENSKEVLNTIKDFTGSIFSNGKETVTFLSEEDLKDGSLAKDLGVKINVGDIHIFTIGSSDSGKVYSNVKIEKINDKEVITAKGLNKKFVIIDKNSIKDIESGSIYKKI